MTEPSVLAEVRNHVGHLYLNRSSGLNALTLEMVRGLQHYLNAWAADSAIVAVVLRSSSEKAFCAGGDIRFLYDSFKSGDGQHMVFFEEEYALDQSIHHYGKPIVSLMNGLVLGGGMGLVQGTRFRVVSEKARMGMPETGIGYFPDVGGSYFLSRLAGGLGAYLAVTGAVIRSADALYAGLADYCVNSELLNEIDHGLNIMRWSDRPEADIESLLKRVASNKLPGSELKAIRPAIDQHFTLDELPSIIDSLKSEDCAAYQDWAENTLIQIQERSPLAMNVSLELIRRGRHLSLEQCFSLELHLDRQWFISGDIMEGIRALIIDKDKNPKWHPAQLTDVTQTHIDDFFREPLTHVTQSNQA